MASKKFAKGEKKRIAKFVDVTGENGWTLSKSDATKRYDLRKDGALLLSDVSLNPCVVRASKHEVAWAAKPEIDWVFE